MAENTHAFTEACLVFAVIFSSARLWPLLSSASKLVRVTKPFYTYITLKVHVLDGDRGREEGTSSLIVLYEDHVIPLLFRQPLRFESMTIRTKDVIYELGCEI
ncbi:hypothetical protein E2C01_051334 [Portunus trituberculatus]|uniref:Uncharacterized protein n=1 Tax=Portunus trituberculatus TaxID=210409 RepID=A0A5B7GIX5_PORTR|nr:hypothetical protein [Portunus trituberculatus]